MGRRAHAFHRFAHHPLCAAYDREVFRLGRRTRVCRGCASIALGAAAGAIAGILTPPLAPAAAGAAAVAAVAALALAAALRAVRPGKLWTRALPATLLAFLFTAGIRQVVAGGVPRATGWSRPSLWTGTAGVGASVLLLAAALAWYRRRGPDRTPCRTCDEHRRPRACSGFARIARREAAFSRVAGRLLAGAAGRLRS